MGWKKYLLEKLKVIRSKVIITPLYYQKILIIFFMGVLINVVYIFVDYYLIGDDFIQRKNGFLSNPNYAAFSINSGFCILLYLVSIQKKLYGKIVLIGLGSIFPLSILATGSRSGLLIFFFDFHNWIFFVFWRKTKCCLNSSVGNFQ